MVDKIIYMRPGETLEIRHLTHEDFDRNAKSWQAQARPERDLIKINRPHSITPATPMLECKHWKDWGKAEPMPASDHHALCSVQKGGACDYDCPRDYTPPVTREEPPSPPQKDGEGE